MKLRSVECLPIEKVDIPLMVEEYNTFIKPNLSPIGRNKTNNVLVHSMFPIDFDTDEGKSLLDSIPQTKQAIQQLIDKYSIINMVFRVVHSNCVYSWHTDLPGTPFYHIPLITNEGCWFIYEGKSFSMPADGSSYRVDTRVPHSFMNAGPEDRVHIVCTGLELNPE